MLVSLWVVLPASMSHAGDSLIRVSDGENQYTGKVLALTNTTCSMMDRQGKLMHLDVSQLKTFERIAERFQPFSGSVFRDELLREFPGQYDVAATTHYLVCAPRGRSRQYAELFESIYRDTEQFYRVRGFKLAASEVPLVAIVFGTQREFMQYCIRDGVPPSADLQGYYSLNSNRVALFADENLLKSVDANATGAHFSKASGIAALAAISTETAGTIVHETTHQVGYNIGIHSRLGGTPVWVIEGLATVLEPDGMRHRSGRNLLSDRLNPERFHWFRQQRRGRRHNGDLASLIASDDFFHQNALDSYSEAWGLTFFLLQNPSRQRAFANYLQTLQQRDPLMPYDAADRLKDFQSAFGDISRLEVEFIRYMDRM